MIQVYTAFVTSSHLYVKGRVLKNRSPISFENQGPISSLFNTILRANSKELPDTKIQCVFGPQTFEDITDEEGYFEFIKEVKGLEAIPKKVTLKGNLKGGHVQVDQTLRTYQYDVPHGIISDIDDTLLVTHVRSFFRLKLLFNTVFVNPFRRKPIEHASEALHALLSKSDGQNPMIYLSNSPWNIYDYIQDFLVHNAFPVGELIMRDMGMQLIRTRKLDEYNKYREIEKLLMMFADTNFTLIGDTGELDFDIYKMILEKYPERVDRIIMRNAGNEKKNEEVQSYMANASHEKVKIIYLHMYLII